MMPSQHSLSHRHKVIEGRSTHQECERKYVVNATSRQSFEHEPQARDATSIWDSIKDGLETFNKFTRPYSAIGAVFEATSMSLIAVEKLSDLSLVFCFGWLQAVVAAFFMNTYNCGLNQLCDVEIDKINKPDLPLASGKLSFRTGVIIVASSLILGLWFAWIIGSWPMFWILFVVNSMLAAAYSVDLPMLRWKKSPVLTTTNFLTNAALARPLGYFLHMQTCVFKRAATFPKQLGFCAAILSIFAVVIALFKDIPDAEGDEKFGIRSLSIRLGPKRVFWICISLLNLAYGGAILVGATSPFLWSKIFMVLGHAILTLILWYRAKDVDLKSNTASQSFYMFIWKILRPVWYLFQWLKSRDHAAAYMTKAGVLGILGHLLCAEYLLIPLFR